MKTKFILSAAILLVFFTCCSTSGDDETFVNDDGRKLRQLTIAQVEEDEVTRSLVALTRASLEEDAGGKTLSASWTKDDCLAYCNLSDLYGAPGTSIGYLKATATAATSSFDGGIVCTKDDRVAVVYPYKENNIISTTNGVTFTLDLKNQDGTLETLAKDYHFICGIAKIESVTDNTASATIQMKSLLAICRFSFADENGNPISVNNLSICYSESGGFGRNEYPTSVSITVSQSVEPEDVIANGILDKSNKILTISTANGLNDVYVALFPTRKRDYFFTVQSTDGDTYEGTATATLNAGKFVPATLTLNRTNTTNK